MTTIDPATNLPQLPEGCRWRVIENEFSGKLIVLCEKRMTRRTTRQEGPRWARQTIQETRESWLPVDREEVGGTPVDIREGAKKIMARMKAVELRRSLVGTYPPKTLEDA